MNRDQALEYQANLLRASARHKELVQEYTHPEFRLRGSNAALEAALTEAGDRLAHSPPLEEHEGVWLPKGMGCTRIRVTTTPLLLRPLKPSEVIPVEEWAQYLADEQEPPSVEPFVLGIKDQGRVGSCTCEAGTGLLETLLNFIGRKAGPFNPLFTYQHVNGGRDAGSSLEDVIADLQTTGACPEAVWPRSKGWAAKQPPEAFEAARRNRLAEVIPVRSQAEFGTLLIERKGIHLWYNGHSIYGVRLLSLTQMRWPNSWGTGWGDGGYGTMALASLSYSGFYAYGSAQYPE